MDGLPTILAACEVVFGSGIELNVYIFQFFINDFVGADLLQTIWWEAFVIAVLDDLVGVHDDRDEQGEDDIDEQADEEVEVDSAAI